MYTHTTFTTALLRDTKSTFHSEPGGRGTMNGKKRKFEELEADEKGADKEVDGFAKNNKGGSKGKDQSPSHDAAKSTAVVLYEQGKSPFEALFGPNGPTEAMEALLSRLDVGDVKALRQALPALSANPILKEVEANPLFRNLLLGFCQSPIHPAHVKRNHLRITQGTQPNVVCGSTLRDGPLYVCEVHHADDRVVMLCEGHFIGMFERQAWFDDELNEFLVDWIVKGLCVNCEWSLLESGVDTPWCQCESELLARAQKSRCQECRVYDCYELKQIYSGMACEDCIMSKEDFLGDHTNRRRPQPNPRCLHKHRERLDDRNQRCRICRGQLTPQCLTDLHFRFYKGDPLRRNSWKILGPLNMFLWCPICNGLLNTPWIEESEKVLGCLEPTKGARYPPERTPDTDGSCTWDNVDPEWSGYDHNLEDVV